DILNEMGDDLLSSPPPWIRKTGRPGGSIIRHFQLSQQEKMPSKSILSIVNSDMLFALFAIIAAMLSYEAIADKTIFFEELIGHIKNGKHPILAYFRHLILAHFEQISEDTVQMELDKCNFTSEQRNFAWRWIRRQIDLVEIIEAVHKDKAGKPKTEQEDDILD
ncbi:MAG TPA: hypothetical protein VIX20_02640, partial [Ktedonobacteraceae bacterium]